MDPSNVEEGQKGIQEVYDKEVDAGNTNGTETSDDCDLSALSLWERDANTDDDVNSVTMDNRNNDDVRGDNGLTVNEVKETTMISTSEVTPKSQKENSSDFVSPLKDRYTTVVSDGIQSESVKDLGSGIDKQQKDEIPDTELPSEKKDGIADTELPSEKKDGIADTELLSEKKDGIADTELLSEKKDGIADTELLSEKKDGIADTELLSEKKDGIADTELLSEKKDGIADTELPSEKKDGIADTELPSEKKDGIADTELLSEKKDGIADTELLSEKKDGIADTELLSEKKDGIADTELPSEKKDGISHTELPSEKKDGIADTELPSEKKDGIADTELPSEKKDGIADTELPSEKKDGIADTELPSEKKNVLLKTFSTNKEPSLTTTTGPQKTTGSLSIIFAASRTKRENFPFRLQVPKKKPINHRHRAKASVKRNQDATKDDSFLKYVTMCTSESDKLKACIKCQKLCKTFDFCENCMVYFCRNCFTASHWLQVQNKLNHTIAKDVPVFDICCATHGELYRYYCQNCKKKKCSDCVAFSSECKSQGLLKLSDHIQYKKSSLREAGNKLTSQCSNISDHLRKAIWRQEEKLKLQTIAQQERLSQEFTSMRELLSEREAYLCNQMDQSLCNSLEKLSDLRAKAGEELEESGHLTSLLLDIVNEPSSTNALTGIENFEYRGRSHTDKLKQLRNTSVKEITVPDVLLSLYEEKTRILQSTSIESFSNKLFKAKRHLVFISGEKTFLPVRAADLISLQDVLPTSTSYTINLTILSCHHPKHQLDRITISDLNNTVLNGPGLVQLRPEEKYLMKFEVARTLKFSLTSERVTRELLHIFIVTDIPMPMAVDTSNIRLVMETSHLDCSFRYRLNLGSFEEARYKDMKRVGTRWNHYRDCIPARGGNVGFNPPISQCSIVKNGLPTTVNTRHQCITAMDEYNDLSLEELRCKDYMVGRKGRKE